MRSSVRKAAIERLCVVLMNRLLEPDGLTAVYLGTESRFDVRIDDRSGTVGWGDITADTDPDLEALRSCLEDCGQRFPLPPGSGRWFVSLESAVRIDRLLDPLGGLVSDMNAAGLRALHLVRHAWPRIPLTERALALGVSSLERIGNRPDEAIVIEPTRGGQIDCRAEVFIDYVDRALARTGPSKRIRKLSEAPGERHLVLKPGDVADEHSIGWILRGWSHWPGLPTAAHQQAESLTDVWLVNTDNGRVVRYNSSSGWTTAGPLGLQWYTDYADFPEVAALLEAMNTGGTHA